MPQPIHQLIVNEPPPLTFVQPNAADNLRTIRDLMKSAAREVGAPDLAALEHEIADTDNAINKLVYELYNLRPEEITSLGNRRPSNKSLLQVSSFP
jgi:hypothetical protein